LRGIATRVSSQYRSFVSEENTGLRILVIIISAKRLIQPHLVSVDMDLN
jgi:hypothetical protein